MANILNTDKQIAIAAAIAKGSSIRAIERTTGIRRDTFMRLGVIPPALSSLTAVRGAIMQELRNAKTA